MPDIAAMIAPLPAKAEGYGIQQRDQNIQEKETAGEFLVEVARFPLS
jgi:hypothetical protein